MLVEIDTHIFEIITYIFYFCISHVNKVFTAFPNKMGDYDMLWTVCLICLSEIGQTYSELEHSETALG